MATIQQWVAGARPRTLPAAFAPVAVGTGAAAQQGQAELGWAILALLVAVSLQVGVNYANDYSDGVRGTDNSRVGPVRLVGQRLADPVAVKTAAYASFGFAALAGMALVAVSGAWLLLFIGAAAIVAAWRYTGGSKPYGYRGLGELAVFIFFGLVAVLGTQWTQSHALSWQGLAGAVAIGSFACALLVVNNLRDIPGDRNVGKRTLAVRLGAIKTRTFYLALTLVAFGMVPLAAIGSPWVLITLLASPVAFIPTRIVLSNATGTDLIRALSWTGAAQLAFAVLFAIGLSVS